MKRFTAIKLKGFEEYGIWDNKRNTRTAFHAQGFSKEQIFDYIDKLNKKHRSI